MRAGECLFLGGKRPCYRQRVTHFTEELSFLSESDKDWVMGRAILARLKWA
jgi:hypothetical protein